jgi:serine/threonine protein kinase
LRALCVADPVFAARYDGWEVLGVGETAAVVRTLQRVSRLPVALKVFWRGSRRPAGDLEGEVQALMRVFHPCVLRTYGVIDQGTLSWIEMEPVEGRTLRDELDRARDSGQGEWPLAHRLEIAACLAEGLAAVHAAGFVHRDVKPDNVLLPASGVPAAKLADFGVARSVDATVAGEGWVSGSPRYVSPEAVRGEMVGPAADVYALGLTLYELLSGGSYAYPLREKPSVGEILECHRGRAPLPLRVGAAGVPDEVIDVVHRALDKAPARRPTAEVLASALRATQREPCPAPAVRRSRWAPAWLALAFVLGMGVGAGVAFAIGLWLALRR